MLQTLSFVVICSKSQPIVWVAYVSEKFEVPRNAVLWFSDSTMGCFMVSLRSGLQEKSRVSQPGSIAAADARNCIRRLKRCFGQFLPAKIFTVLDPVFVASWERRYPCDKFRHTYCTAHLPGKSRQKLPISSTQWPDSDFPLSRKWQTTRAPRGDGREG